MEGPALDHVFSAETMVEEYRDMFKDYSGYLSINEFYTVLLTQGIAVSKKELVEMVTELDADRDGKISIDEFVEIMTSNEEMDLETDGAKNTYFKLKKARKLNP
jgi:Ca2+-binding EF-hand superfamily protein